MKKLFVLMLCGAFACCLAVAGCGGNEEIVDDEQMAVPEEQAAPEEEPAPEEPQTGMANPWSDAASAEEAAEIAGLEFFEVPTDMFADMELVTEPTYQASEGIAQADYEMGAAAGTVRKGLATAVPEGSDISGDYNEYANTWTISVKGLEVTCFGNDEGRATKSLWSVDDTVFSIVVEGLGGDDNFGLDEDQLNSIIESIQ